MFELILAQADATGLRTWWDIAQLAGAGAAVVLGPVAWLLWKQHQEDTRYIRDSDKNTLTILAELAKTLESVGNEQGALNGAIDKARDDIIKHIDRTSSSDG